MTERTVNMQPRPDFKAEVLRLLDRLDMIQPGDTGNITVHISDGAVRKITKQIEVK